MELQVDERCPCIICLVQRNCTDYCSTFHFYRKMILAEMDFYFALCILDYDPDSNEGRFMSDLERQIDIAYEVSAGPTKEYYEIKSKLRYLIHRFDVILENSRSARRGVAMTSATLQGNSYSNFMKQAQKQLKGRHEKKWQC